MLFTQLRPAIILFILLSILTGILYPYTVTGIAQAVFHKQANGSLIVARRGDPPGRPYIAGSSLIGQNFDDPKYFWGRISATSPAYNASSSTGSNLGPLNPALMDEVKGRMTALKAVDFHNTNPIPVDLVTSSASGLDPDISLAAAYYQIPRIARLRHLSEDQVRALIDQHTQGRFLGLLGEPVVNVLELNLALDQFKK